MINIVENILKHLIRHRFPVLFLTSLFTLFMGFQATKIEIRADTKSLLTNSEVLLERFKDCGIPQNEYLVIGVEKENLFEMEYLQTLNDSIHALEGMPETYSIVTPFNQTAFEKKGSFFTLVQTSESGQAPQSEEELNRFKNRITGSALSKGLLLSQDEELFLILLEYGEVEDFNIFMDEVETCLKPLREISQVYITGNPPFEVAAGKYLARDITILLSLGIFLILTVYFFGFKSKRSIFLPILVVISGTVWTIGFMSLMGFALSMVSIVVPPLVLTLGSSYSIHILNSYFRFAPQGTKDKLWIAGAVSSVSSTIILASLTTVVGFLSLMVTSLSQLREFALASSFGILSCALLTLIVLPCALTLMRNPKEHQMTGIHKGYIAKLIRFITEKVIRHQVVILTIFLIIPLLFLLTYPHLKINTDYATYFPQEDTIIQDMNHLVEKIGGFSELTIVFEAEEPNFFLNRDTLESLNNLEKDLSDLPDITHTRSFNTFVTEAQYVTRGNRDFPQSKGPVLFLSRALNSYRNGDAKSEELINGFVNQDFSRYNITFRYYNSENGTAMGENKVPDLLAEVEKILNEEALPDVTWQILGPRLFYQELYNRLTKDLALSTVTAFLLIFLVASYTFRSFLYGGLSLIPMLAGVLLNFVIMVLLGIPLDLTTVMVSCVSIGIGVDDSIHFLLHYQRDEDLNHTMELTGRPIILTSLSIMAGLILLLFSTFRPIGYFGILISIALFNTTIGCLFFLPCFIVLIEKIRLKKGLKKN
jgi:uncharacterized protein